MSLKDIDSLYGKIILDHFRKPRNHHIIYNPDSKVKVVNPFCGDEVDLQVSIQEKKIYKIGIQSRGCSINQASSSLLSIEVLGKDFDQILVLEKLLKDLMNGSNLTNQETNKLGDLHKLTEISKFPVRIKCVLLAWTAMEEIIEKLTRKFDNRSNPSTRN